jgi:hypothetical protein
MDALLQQLPTLLGVAVGAAVTYVAAAVTERSRWRRQLAVRWDDRRLAAYVEYANSLKQALAIAVGLAGQLGLHAGDVGARTYSNRDLSEAEERRTLAWEAVLMLGSEDVVLAARAWHDCYFRLQRLALGQPGGNWREAVDAAAVGRRLFYEAARADLGLPPSRRPETFEWQFNKWAPQPATIRTASGDGGDGPDEPIHSDDSTDGLRQ